MENTTSSTQIPTSSNQFPESSKKIRVNPETSFRNDLFKGLLHSCSEKSLYHLKCRGETPGDLLCGLEILRRAGYKLCYIKMITISCMVADLEFMTDISCDKVQQLWDDYMNDSDEKWVQEIHRMIQTLKPFKEYTGKIDNSFYEN